MNPSAFKSMEVYPAEGTYVSALQRNVYALCCPRCSTVTTKRRDALALGLHQVICQGCGFTTNRVEHEGEVHAVTGAEAHGHPEDGK